MSIRDDYTDDEWNKLTPEEQKGLLLVDADEAGEESEEDIEGEGAGDLSDIDRLAANDRKAAILAAQQEEEAGDEGEAAAAAAAAAGEGGDAAAAAAGGEGGDAAAAAAAAAAADTTAGSTVPLPKAFNAELAADYNDRVQENENQQTANLKAYDDGDISFQEYQTKQRQLDRDSRKLEKEKDDVELDKKLARQSVMDEWRGLMNGFLPSHPELNASQIRMNVFDTILQRVTAETLNKGNMPGMAEVDKAYKEWCAEFEFKPKEAAASEKPGAKPVKAKQPIKAPPTLGSLPAAQANNADEGRFANLDRLTGEAYEAAFAKLSPDERDAYLQGA